MKINAAYFNFYGLFIMVSIIVGILLVDIFLIRWRVNKFHIIVLDILFLFLIPMFGLFLTFIEHFILTHKVMLGFSAYGGLFGMILSVYLFSWIFKYNKKHLLKIICISAPLMYSIAKIGCLFAGCCYGIVYSGVGNVVYISSHGAPLDVQLLPIQFVESIFFLFVFIYLSILYNNKNKKIMEISLILCGIIKFFLEFFRESWCPIVSFTQIISIIFVFMGLYLFKRRRIV